MILCSLALVLHYLTKQTNETIEWGKCANLSSTAHDVYGKPRYLGFVI